MRCDRPLDRGEVLDQEVFVGADPELGRRTGVGLALHVNGVLGALGMRWRTYDPNGPLDLDEMINAALGLILGGWATDIHTS